MAGLTKEQEERALDLAFAGQSMDAIRDAIGVSPRDFWRYVEANSDFAARFSRARHIGLEEIADSLLTVHDTYQDVQRARIYSDNARFLLSKRKPEVYGDRIDVNVNQTVDVRGALLEARARLRPISDQSDIQDAEYVEIEDKSDEGAGGSKPTAPSEEDPFS